MENAESFPRSPELMSRDDTALLVVDAQEKLLAAVANADRLVWNIRRLIDAARILGLPVLATEQYPKGLGPTIADLAGRLGVIPAKQTFSAAGCPELSASLRELQERGVYKILVCGVEAHVCVAQTAMDLLADGRRVFIAVDAVGSRFDTDLRTALRRMDSAGATLTTVEAAMFEWCETAAAPEFKQISRLARETFAP